MSLIQTNRSKFFRRSLEEIDEDKILFYDIETDHQFAAYTKLKTIAVQYGFNSKPIMVDSVSRRNSFKQKIESPEIIKVDFNGINFDRIVLARHGYKFNYQNGHDLFLLFKTIAPTVPSFSLKFLNFYYLADPHFPEMALNQWMGETGLGWNDVPKEILDPYNLHDVTQTANLFKVGWDVVIRDEHWKPYLNDLMMGEPLLEMETKGGMYLDKNKCIVVLHRLQKVVQQQTHTALELTHGQVANANSSKQLGQYFSEFDQLEMELTKTGEFKIDKAFLLSCRDRNPVAECAFKIREANAAMKYFENYLSALEDETYPRTASRAWIPVQFSVSSARTRRFTSQSLYKLNFQNPSEEADEVQVIPEGQLGWSFDATQVENIVHIYESEDWLRRQAYEADPNWNEYVWLCNMTYGVTRTKDEWDDKKLFPSTVVPHWSIYKEKKSVKLGMNFGMGVDKYCKMNGLDHETGKTLYSDVHQACPAIHELQRKVARNLQSDGFVQDALGWRYGGSVDQAYKVVAYMIQGCGTGGLPKLQIRANWESLRRFDKFMPANVHRCGVMCQTTHDENSGRIDLRLGVPHILQLLQKMHQNMTKKFSHYFDDIPLRAKMYLWKTNKHDKIECDINDINKIETIILGEPCPLCNGRSCKTCNQIGYIK